MKTRLLAAAALLSTSLLALGLQPAHADDAGRAPDAGRLDSGLQILAAAAERGQPLTEQTAADGGHGAKVLTGARLEHGDVLVNVYVDGSVTSAAAALQGLGMRVTGTSDRAPERLVAGWLPATRLLDATALSGTRAILTVHAGTDAADGTDAGSVLSQGDAIHHGPQARALGATGAGVKVGVISDSINQQAGGVATSQASGDLPSSVSVLADDPGQSDEGRAMAEIIYDEAPGITQMYFSTGTVSAAGKAASINNLVASGVKVIADDIFYLDEPMFQDGQVAQAVDAAKAAGVSYFASAGNRAKQSWEGTYNGGADEDFDPGAGTDTIQSLGNFNGTSPYISLQWAEPWSAATTDLALDWYVDDVLVATPDANNIVSGIPNEVEQITFSGVHNVGIGIRRVSGTGTPKLKYIAGGVSTFTIQQFPTDSNAINPDAASAAGSMAVAASNWSTPTSPEPYSSRGPSITRRFDSLGNVLTTPVVRPKPALDAADAVATSVPGFNPFGGTSAATPSAAGIAALIRSANPTLSVDVVAAILTNPAYGLDCTPTAGQPDLDCGSGFIQADSMVAAAKDASPPAVTSATTPAGGPGGWFSGTVSVSWAVADGDSPVYAMTGCAAATFSAPGTSSCSATSVGGTTSKSLVIRIDRTKPTKVKFKGIKKHYAHGTRPVKKKVKCKARDGESGIVSCKIKGFKATPGKHTIKAVATNGAGLKTTKRFTYTID
ncbi:MAG: hypothetical protein QOD98_4482 [Nocardioidaceae bacterium]|nr:hypothetical protein [Nocardioidaceae bacterium]